MNNSTLSLRQRFDRLRSSMGWSWKDIDFITGRKNARTNIAKRVPAWSILAIHAHESHAVLLRHYIIEVIRLHLGSNWNSSHLSGGSIAFHGTPKGKVESLIIEFKPTSFTMTSSSSKIYEVTEKLKSLHPTQGDIFQNEDGDYEVEIPILL